MNDQPETPNEEQPAAPEAMGTVEEPTTPPTKEEQTMALIAHLLGIFTSFIGCLIIWLIKKEESDYIGDQAKEALNFQLTMLIAIVIGIATSCLGIGVLIIIAAQVVILVFSIIAAIKANDGVRYRYPVSIRMIK